MKSYTHTHTRRHECGGVSPVFVVVAGAYFFLSLHQVTLEHLARTQIVFTQLQGEREKKHIARLVNCNRSRGEVRRGRGRQEERERQRERDSVKGKERVKSTVFCKLNKLPRFLDEDAQGLKKARRGERVNRAFYTKGEKSEKKRQKERGLVKSTSLSVTTKAAGEQITKKERVKWCEGASESVCTPVYQFKRTVAIN